MTCTPTRCLTTTVTVLDNADLRPLRQSKNITLTAAARQIWPTAIPTLERGLRRDDELARAYRDWLAAAWLLWVMAADLSAGNR